LEPRYLRTVHGVGIRLVDPDADGDEVGGSGASRGYGDGTDG
jgi:hypothetical protein